MTKLNKVSTNKDKNLAAFLFKITQTENGIELKGIEGTAWTELNSLLPKTKNKRLTNSELKV